MAEHSIIKPIYQQIALDIAMKIANGEFSIGSKIHGRSTLAGQYNVSPETIRRAVILLQDMDVVNVSQGSGIVIKSQEEALKFIDRFNDIESIASLKIDLLKLLNSKNSIEKQMQITTEKIIDYSDRLRNISPYSPLEVELTAKCRLIGKTISEVKFWQNTGGTIIAIRRGKDIILSPGPYAELRVDDILVVVGDEGVLLRINKLLYKK